MSEQTIQLLYSKCNNRIPDMFYINLPANFIFKEGTYLCTSLLSCACAIKVVTH